jgi:hypothetical protein
MSSHQCEAITKAGTRCTRNAEPNSNFCWQHDNYLNDFPTDLLKYGLNQYLNFIEDIPKLEQMLEDFKFDIEPHIRVKNDYYKNGNIKFIRTYIDDTLSKNEGWYQNGEKYFEDNYTNGIRNGEQYIWNSNGTIKDMKIYRNGVLMK